MAGPEENSLFCFLRLPMSASGNIAAIQGEEFN